MLWTIIIFIFVIVSLLLLRNKLMGNSYPQILSNKENIKDKIVLIISHNKNKMIENIAKFFVDNEAYVIIMSSDKKISSYKRITNLYLDTSDLNEVNKTTEYLLKYLAKIDYLIYNSMDIKLINNNKNEKSKNVNNLTKEECLLNEENKDKNNRNNDEYTHPLLLSNTLSYFLIVMKLIKILNLGEGRIINIIGDVFKHSSLCENINMNFFSQNKTKTNTESKETSNEKINSFNYLEKCYKSYLEDMKNDNYNHIQELYSHLIRDKKNKKIFSLSDYDNVYSDTCLLNLYLLKFLKEYVDIHFENITINAINPGIYISTFKEYLKLSYFRILFLPLTLPFAYILLKNDYWIIQPIINLICGKQYIEIVNGGYYNKDCEFSRTCSSATNLMAKNIYVMFLFSNIKRFFEDEDNNKFIKTLGELREKIS